MPRRRTYRFRVPHNLAMHPAVTAVGLPALGLWVRAGAYVARDNPDGIISAVIVRSWRATRHARRLVETGLWEPATDCCGRPAWRFVGWRAYPDGGGVIL